MERYRLEPVVSGYLFITDMCPPTGLTLIDQAYSIANIVSPLTHVL